MCRVGFGELHAEVWEFGVERAWWDITGRDWVTVPQIPLNGEADGLVPCSQMVTGPQYSWEGPEELRKGSRGHGGLRVLTQDLLPAAGPFLRLHHPVCGASLGCHHRPHGGLLHQQNIMDPLWPPDALVRASCSTPHPRLICHSAPSQLWVSIDMSFAVQDVLMLYLTQVRCQVLQKAQGAASSWGFKSVPVTLTASKPSPHEVGLAVLHVTAPAAAPASLRAAPMPDFVAAAFAKPWPVAGPRCQQSRWHHTRREEGRGCAQLMHGGGVPADSHEDALLAGKQLSWIWVSACGRSCCPWKQGAERRGAEGSWRRWDGVCKALKGSMPAPRAELGHP